MNRIWDFRDCFFVDLVEYGVGAIYWCSAWFISKFLAVCSFEEGDAEIS